MASVGSFEEPCVVFTPGTLVKASVESPGEAV